jgi:hypothetical protein
MYAEKYQIPLIFWGESQLEATQDFEGEAFRNLGLKRKKYSRLLSPYFYHTEFLSLLQRLEFHVPGNSIFHRGISELKNKNIKEIKLFDYFRWNREEIKDTITNELGWQMPEGSVSTWRTDCDLHSLLNHFYFKMFGCSKECFGYCKMINSGQMLRQDALKQEEALAAVIEQKIPELLKERIGLSEKETNQILKLRV